VIEPENIESKTIVTESGNERLQDVLDTDSLSDILVTMKITGQSFAGIGFNRPCGMIEVLDGSRRRMSCILAAKPFKVYVTDSTLSVSDLDFLKSVFDSQKELSQYEKAIAMRARFYAMNSDNKVMTQKDFADVESKRIGRPVSERSVSNALTMASVPDEIIRIFPDVSMLSNRLAVDLMKSVRKFSFDPGIVEIFEKELTALADSLDALKSDHPVWLEKFKVGVKEAHKNIIGITSTKKTVKPVFLYKKDTHTYIKKKDNGNRKVTFEVSRVPSYVIDEIEKFIMEKAGDL
jgi:ParB/RepB/Spo0J family partition protein